MREQSLWKSMLIMAIMLVNATYCLHAYALIKIVAAENTYGEVVKEIGGPYVSVINIISNPSQDPHLFSTTPSTAKAINEADIVIYNGANYDSWMEPILAVGAGKNRYLLNVAELMKIKPEQNPHIWYMPTTMPTFTKVITNQLVKRDPQHKAFYENNLVRFTNQYQTVIKKIKQLKDEYQYTPVIATEPVFGYMAASLDLQMQGEKFQINMMNDVPPTISQIKQFEDDLYQHKVRVLIYNNQVINPLTEQIRSIAVNEKIPVIGVSEMIEPGMTYIQWIMKELSDLDSALKRGH